MIRLNKLYSIIISFIIVLIVSIQQTLACGPSLMADDARFFIFNTSIINYPQVQAFLYTQNPLHDYNAEELFSDRTLNCKEWNEFTKNQATVEDIDAIQYSTTADSFLLAYTNNDWKSFANNTFINWLLKKKNKKALQYFVLAKEIEKNQQWKMDKDPWTDDQIPDNYPSIESLQQKCYELLQKKQPSFLKERYAFQYVKCSYYNYLDHQRQSDITLAKKIFQQYLENKKTITAQWALIYYADMQTDALEATRYFIKAFDQCEEKKVRAYSYLSTESLDNLKKATKDEELLVLINVLQSLKNKGRALEQIKYVYSHDSHNKYLPLLITREVSKIEDWILSPEILYFGSYLKSNSVYQNWQNNKSKTQLQYAHENYLSDRQYLKEVLQYLKEVQLDDKNFGRLAIAHLEIINEEYSNAENTLNTVDINSKSRQVQWLIDKAMILANTQDILNTKVQEEMASTFRQLNDLGYKFPQSSESDYYYYAHNETNPGPLYMYLSRKFEEKKDFITASLLSQKSRMLKNEYLYVTNDSIGYAPIAYLDKYGSPDDVDKLISLKHKKDKTPFEEWLVPIVWGDDNMYLDLKGSLLLRQMKFEEAKNVFEKMPDDFWETEYEFKSYLPQYSISNLGTLLPATSGYETQYATASKKLITQEIINIKNKIDNSESRDTQALYSFYLANALYNISHYGNFWMLSVYGNSSNEPYIASEYNDYRWVYHYLYPSEVNHAENYYGLQSTIDAYKKALSLADNNNELAAKCTLMLAYCDAIAQDYQYVNAHPDNYWENQNKYQSPYLQQLKNNYSNTLVYENAMNECPDVRDHLLK